MRYTNICFIITGEKPSEAFDLPEQSLSLVTPFGINKFV
jgi:hypothetical protein